MITRSSQPRLHRHSDKTSGVSPSVIWLFLAFHVRHWPVVEEELLSGLDGSLGKDSDPVIAVHHHHCREQKQSYHREAETSRKLTRPDLCTFCIAVRVHRVVGEADLVAFPRGINNKVWKEESISDFILKTKSLIFRLFSRSDVFAVYKDVWAECSKIKKKHLRYNIRYIYPCCVLPLFRLNRKLHMYLS